MAWNTNWQITAHAMSYSVVNDLAKAMKALDGKKRANKIKQGGDPRFAKWLRGLTLRRCRLIMLASTE